MFELLKVVQKVVVGHHNGQKSQETWSTSTEHTREGDRLHTFSSTLLFCVTVLQLNFKNLSGFVPWLHGQMEHFN